MADNASKSSISKGSANSQCYNKNVIHEDAKGKKLNMNSQIFFSLKSNVLNIPELQINVEFHDENASSKDSLIDLENTKVNLYILFMYNRNLSQEKAPIILKLNL